MCCLAIQGKPLALSTCLCAALPQLCLGCTLPLHNLTVFLCFGATVVPGCFLCLSGRKDDHCGHCCMQKEDSRSKLAVAEGETGKIHIFDVRSGSDAALHSFEVHRTPVVAMGYNAAHDSVISVDQRGTAASFTVAHDLVPRYSTPHVRVANPLVQQTMRQIPGCRDDRVLVCKGLWVPRRGCGLQHKIGHRPLCPAKGQGASTVPGRQQRWHHVCHMVL